ncbi:MerR family transcriptional regulator [Variovorax fucosicus]|uniref:MerR family transcriptional regulator n=1 Tax=Variovorax fucosicus TaxID=3053517 RepID=UPI00257916ED|nr:MerR family transcriptional regulator [Variovorax sp. J22G47]MDM0054735.1 MerR family transcriptional regulator [Variovorax sp. J22G47]
MRSPAPSLSPSEAARRLGVSAKALRLYEQRGLVDPGRTTAGWRAYGQAEMTRAAEIVALRALGFSLAQVGRVLQGNSQGLEPALAAHQEALEAQLRQLARTVEKVRGLRSDVAQGQTPTIGELAGLLAPASEIRVAFDLPWPWGGERFELREIRPLNYIIGPLGSGKTRLAQRLAQALPNAAWLGLERLADGGAAARSRLDGEPALKSRLDQALAWLAEDGATPSDALVALLAGLEADGPDALVVDMIEQGLDQATQEALMARLRRRGADARPIFMLTRSCAILDLSAVGPDEAIILCPANHSPPTKVAPYPGAPGYEAVATCLASPEVRARTAGLVAWRQPDLASEGSKACERPPARESLKTPD